MPKYKVIRPFWFTLTAVVEAANADEVLETFDAVPEEACKNEYVGLLGSHDDAFSVEVS